MTRSGMKAACRRSAAAISRRIEHARTILSSLSVAGRCLAAGIALIAFPVTSAVAADVSRDQRQWWIDRYGLIDAKREPLVTRAERIFSRVAAAADKKGNWLPKLVVIGGTGDPYASAIRDGSVILTLEALKICYTNAAPETGDARLAFLLGHELAHFAKDDFWHSNALAAVSRNTDDGQVRRDLASQLEKTGGSPEFVKTQELQADSYGLLYMTMAGYDPQVIIGKDTANFFHYWVSQINGSFAYGDEAHVSPEARAEFVRAELQPVIAALERFHQGVQQYQNGDYRASASSFEGFIEKYPGREVYNDLGLSHYQLALQSLSECSTSSPVPKLPTVLDPVTTAQRLHRTAAADGPVSLQHGTYQTNPQEAVPFIDEMEKNGSEACLQKGPYRANLHEAIRLLEDAEKKDATYQPARINLSTALILSGNYAKAISVADEILKDDPGNPEALANKAAAEQLFSRKNRAEKPGASDDRIWAGLSIDIGNFSMGPTVVWWPSGHYGLQASYGQGTFTLYSIRVLMRFGKIAGLTPYVGLGYLSLEHETNVFGVETRFSANGGEILAGAVLPISKRVSLLTAVTANSIKLEDVVSVKGQSLPVTVTYSPLSATATLVYAF